MVVVACIMGVLTFAWDRWSSLPLPIVRNTDNTDDLEQRDLKVYVSQLYSHLFLPKSFGSAARLSKSHQMHPKAVNYSAPVTLLWYNSVQWLNIRAPTMRGVEMSCQQYGGGIYPPCFLTSDRSKLPDAHIVSVLLMFDGLSDELALDILASKEEEANRGLQRPYPQLWLAASMESPSNTPINQFFYNDRGEPFILFNATLTYERPGLNQVSNPYGKIEPIQDNMPLGPLPSLIRRADDGRATIARTKLAIVSAQNATLNYRLQSKFDAQQDIDSHVEVGALPYGAKRKYKYTACWAVSHNHKEKPLSSHRDLFYEALVAEGIAVAVFGLQASAITKMGGNEHNITRKKRPRSGQQYMQPQALNTILSTKCKYYLAFENSFATDYITEKFFRSLAQGTVPITLGPPREEYEKALGLDSLHHGTNTDFSASALKRSFIHFTDGLALSDVEIIDNTNHYSRRNLLKKFYIKAAKGLAQIIKEEDKDPRLYRRHFDWLSHYTVVAQDIDWRRGVCNACKFYANNAYSQADYLGIDLTSIASLNATYVRR